MNVIYKDKFFSWIINKFPDDSWNDLYELMILMLRWLISKSSIYINIGTVIKLDRLSCWNHYYEKMINILE